MASKRKPIPNKIRFEVFKRDGFRCQYCGRSAPDVLLQVDHIKPVSAGGTNDITNLITACVECNSGKGATLLDDKSMLERQRRQLQELNERRLQLEMMMQWRDELMKLEEQKFNLARERFEKRANAKLTEAGLKNLHSLMRRYPFEEVIEAIDLACNQYLEEDPKNPGSYTSESVELAFDYIGRICGVRHQMEKKPYIRDLYYIRGILRRRLYYLNERMAMEYLEKSYLAGASIESLMELAKKVKSWSSFRNAIERFLSEHEGQGDNRAQPHH